MVELCLSPVWRPYSWRGHHSSRPCSADRSAVPVYYRKHIWMFLPEGPGSSPGAQTDHPHTRSFDRRSSGRFALHDPRLHAHTQCSLHQSGDMHKHACSDISYRGTPKLHRSRILPPPWPSQCCGPQDVWWRSLRTSCTWFFHTERRQAASALRYRSSRKLCSSVFSDIYHSPCWSCRDVWPHQHGPGWLESVSPALCGSQPFSEHLFSFWAFLVQQAGVHGANCCLYFRLPANTEHTAGVDRQ